MQKWQIRIGLSIGVIVIAMIAFVYFIGNNVPTDDPQPAYITAQATNRVKFPKLRGTNLSFEQVVIPDDLGDNVKLIVISYDDAQQPTVNDWLPPLEALNEKYPMLAGYYVPLLPKDSADAAAFIIGGFAALASENERARTVIVFTNVDIFNELVGIENKDEIQLFFLNTDDTIVWHTSGSYTAEKLAELEAQLSMILTEQE
ncbi:MAG: hypothetical protein CUN55_04960 [Phototrophicales bacterium]|nr:MAG: hypothetical protein CUN55_04960 [Phototrophicales bacterium]